MSEDKLQAQINEINNKLDLVLTEVNSQRLKREELSDLMDDVSIIGKDVFASTVEALDKASIEFDSEAMGRLGIKFVRNIENFNEMFDMFESMVDLMKDLSPIVQQVGLDAIKLMQQFDEKGYLDFIAEIPKMLENVSQHFTVEDVKKLSENMGTALKIYKETSMADTPSYSLWKMMKDMNSPEMKKTLGFTMTFMKSLSAELNKN